MADDRRSPEEVEEAAATNGAPVGRYSGDKRTQFNHRVLETFAQDFKVMSEALVAKGWPAAQVSQAELLQALMHAHRPRTIDEAEALLRQWGLVKLGLADPNE